MKNVKWMLNILGAATMLMTSSLFADYRDFAYTYQARTLPQGEVEFEYYYDAILAIHSQVQALLINEKKINHEKIVSGNQSM